MMNDALMMADVHSRRTLAVQLYSHDIDTYSSNSSGFTMPSHIGVEGKAYVAPSDGINTSLHKR
jgi:hypothetical protein